MKTTMDEEIKRAYSLDSVERFPSYYPGADEKRTGTTFYGDLKVAELCGGIEALDETWGRIWREWKNNALYVIELCIVCNHLCWERYEQYRSSGDLDTSKWYGKKYEFIRNRIFADGSEDEPLPDGCKPFSSEEQSIAFEAMD